MQSQAIDDNGSTTMTAMVTGNGELSFYWKVSSEKDYDMLAFAIDGVKKAEISGTTEWEQKTFTVTGEGEHKLVWTYSKDRSVFSGSDCGWVDDIVWLPDRTLVSANGRAGAHPSLVIAEFQTKNINKIFPKKGKKA